MEKMKFSELNKEDGSWEKLEDDWKNQCTSFDEEIDEYATASLPVLRDIVINNTSDHSIFALYGDDNVHHAICCLNSVFIPGYKSKVLRVRHILLSPNFDFGDFTIEEYGNVLTEVFFGALAVSEDSLRSDHIKFHLRSHADRNFFATLGKNLNDSKLFDSVKFRGAWMYVDKVK